LIDELTVKKFLSEKMIDEIIRHLYHKVGEITAYDGAEYGKFTRAYFHTAFMSEIDGLVPHAALSMTMITETAFNSIFGKWLRLS